MNQAHLGLKQQAQPTLNNQKNNQKKKKKISVTAVDYTLNVFQCDV